MAIRLASHLSRNRYGVLYFRLAVPLDVRPYFAVKEIYRSLQTARLSEAIIGAHTLLIACTRVFNEIRRQTMSDSNSAPKELKPDLASIVKHAKEKISLKEKIEALETKLELSEDDSRQQRLQRQEMLAFVTAVNQGRTSAPAPLPLSAAPDRNLSTYVDAYLTGDTPGDGPNKKTLDSYRAAIDLFIRIVGDKPIQALSVADRNKYDQTIVRVPPNYTKKMAKCGLSLDELIAQSDTPASPVTSRNMARRANQFLGWLAYELGLEKPPIEVLGRLKFKKGESKADQRRAFSNDELRVVFDPDTFAVSKQYSPYMFWLPLIGLHTGMRINEIAQLELRDIDNFDDIACFNVTDETDPLEARHFPTEGKGKKLKTKAGKRIVPIHQRLIEMGLCEYVQTLRRAGQMRLFPDLPPGRDGAGQAASKQFARYCDRINLTSSALVFHSFRHGAVGGMRAAHIAKELRMVVIGHNTIEDTHDGYGDIINDYDIVSKQRAIQALNFDLAINYEALKKKRPSLADLKRSVARHKTRDAKEKLT
jgi:integrase